MSTGFSTTMLPPSQGSLELIMSCIAFGNVTFLALLRARTHKHLGQTALACLISTTSRRADSARHYLRDCSEVWPRHIKLQDFSLRSRPMVTAATRDEPSQVKLLTLVIIQQGGRLLLGMKKRGFGEGYYNGFGGKVEAGETVEEAAARELEEEAGITAVSMVKRGVLTFHFDDKPVPWEVHVFHVDEFTGEPRETDEMSPIWFTVEDIPYDKMWKDDAIWYPPFLKGLSFRGEFFFKNTHELVSHSLQVVPLL